MGTRSKISFIKRYDKGINEHLVSVYQQYDGYIEGVGYELANYLKSKKIINGIPGGVDTSNLANGFECLVAQFIRDFKVDVGGLYITTEDNYQEYNYNVIFDEQLYIHNPSDNVDDYIIIEVDKFKGTPSELLEYKEEYEDDE